MFDILKDWWEFIVFALGGIYLLLKKVFGIQRDVDDLKKSGVITGDMCSAKRANCQSTNKIQFDTAALNMSRIEKRLDDSDRSCWR